MALIVAGPLWGPGLHLIRLVGGDGKTATYLRPVWVGEGEVAAGKPVGAVFADGALRLHGVEATQVRSTRLNLRLDWSATQPIAANYKLGLRFVDPAGNEWARLEEQPGYGFLPTSLWPIGRLIHDRYTLSFRKGIPPGDGYTLTVIPYREATGKILSGGWRQQSESSAPRYPWPLDRRRLHGPPGHGLPAAQHCPSRPSLRPAATPFR